MIIELPSNKMSSDSEAYCTTPCSLATLPVLTTCWAGVHKLTLSPVLLMSTSGEAEPLCMRLRQCRRNHLGRTRNHHVGSP